MRHEKFVRNRRRGGRGNGVDFSIAEVREDREPNPEVPGVLLELEDVLGILQVLRGPLGLDHQAGLARDLEGIIGPLPVALLLHAGLHNHLAEVGRVARLVANVPPQRREQRLDKVKLELALHIRRGGIDRVVTAELRDQAVEFLGEDILGHGLSLAQRERGSP